MKKDIPFILCFGWMMQGMKDENLLEKAEHAKKLLHNLLLEERKKMIKEIEVIGGVGDFGLIIKRKEWEYYKKKMLKSYEIHQ